MEGSNSESDGEDIFDLRTDHVAWPDIQLSPRRESRSRNERSPPSSENVELSPFHRATIGALWLSLLFTGITQGHYIASFLVSFFMWAAISKRLLGRCIAVLANRTLALANIRVAKVLVPSISIGGIDLWNRTLVNLVVYFDIERKYDRGDNMDSAALEFHISHVTIKSRFRCSTAHGKGQFLEVDVQRIAFDAIRLDGYCAARERWKNDIRNLNSQRKPKLKRTNASKANTAFRFPLRNIARVFSVSIDRFDARGARVIEGTMLTAEKDYANRVGREG